MALTRVPRSQSGFTLIELVVVIVLIGMISALVFSRTSSVTFWREDAAVRNLSSTIIFLHHQAMFDRAFYRIEFDLEKRTYVVGVMRAEDADEDLAEYGSDIGTLSLELAAFTNPSLGSAQTFIPPPSFPSLADPVELPEGMLFTDIRTMRGKETTGKPYLLFSPRGFSEFSVIHLQHSDLREVTIMVNPFTGNTEVLQEYKDFEWTYGRNQGEK